MNSVTNTSNDVTLYALSSRTFSYSTSVFRRDGWVVTDFNKVKANQMVFIQEWLDVDPRYVSSNQQLENSTIDILSPIHVQKTIMKNVASINGIVLISQLAKELDVSVEDLLPSIEVLRNLKLVELDDSKGVVRLTNNGKFANLDYLC